MKVCRVAKDIKEIEFGYIRGDLGSGGFGGVSGDSGSQGVWEYLGLALVFVWGSASYFSKFFRLVLTKLSFWWEDWVLDCHSINFSQFPDFSLFPKILSLKPFGNSYIPCL